jgi:hypothetical protein
MLVEAAADGLHRGAYLHMYRGQLDQVEELLIILVIQFLGFLATQLEFMGR